MTDADRLKQVIEYVNFTPNKFAKEIGYSRGESVYQILNGGTLHSKIAINIRTI